MHESSPVPSRHRANSAGATSANSTTVAAAERRPLVRTPDIASLHSADAPAETEAQLAADHFITKNGIACAGVHYILDLYGASRLDDLAHMETTMRAAVSAAHATLLHIHLHHFEPNGGISGVAVLAESHLSVHSWPERAYAAFDVFMCGDADPMAAVEVLRAGFQPASFELQEYLRGTHAANLK